MYIKKLLRIGIITLIVSNISCKKEGKENSGKIPLSVVESNIPVSDGSTYKATILGQKLKNPFQIDTMKKAFRNVTGIECNLQVTHLYVRFLPSSQELYDSLVMDSSLVLYDIPLDYKIKELGDYYQSPGFDLEEITWQYTVVPIDKALPNFVQVEVLDRLFLPNENNVMNCGASTTADALEAEAFRMTGNTSEYSTESVFKNNEHFVDTKRGLRKYHPQGKISMVNTKLGVVGVWNVKVKSRRWFNLDHTYTNSNGDFQISNKYRGKVHINLEFQNENCAIRGVRGFRVWQIADAVDVEVGEFQNSSMENIAFTISDNVNVKSEAKRRWMAASTCNAVEEYRMMAGTNGILLPPKHLNIWLTTEITLNASASAPMLRAMANRSYASAITDLYLVLTGHAQGVLIKRIVSQFLPDITFGYVFSNSNKLNSDVISFYLYHELGHSSHFKQVGNVYWTIYVSYIITNLGYGTPSSAGSTRIEVSEGWADYIGHVFAATRYPRLVSSVLSVFRFDDWNDKIERFLPRFSQFPFDGGGTMFDMTENGEPTAFTGIRDEVNTYKMQEIFRALPFNVTSMQDFHSLVLILNNNKQKVAVDILFSDYGF